LNVHECRLVREVLAAPPVHTYTLQTDNAIEALSRELVATVDQREPVLVLASRLADLRPDLREELGIATDEPERK